LVHISKVINSVLFRKTPESLHLFANFRRTVVSYDLLIRNGTVVDGSGSPVYRADVGVKDGHITSIGRITSPATRTIDADGQVVTPGFIDGHTHMDAQLHWDPLGTSSSWHGITTAVFGNCGFTLAPSRQNERHLVVRNLERAEDIPAEAMAEGITWTWETFPEYLDAIARLPMGINFAANIGHSALRTWAMKERAFTEEASESDLRIMEDQLSAAVRAGAIGFTTSRSVQHETSDGRPVASRAGSWYEVRRLVNTMGQLGAGIFELAPEAVCRSDDPDARAEFLGRLRDLAVESRAPITFGVLPFRQDGEDWREQLRVMDTVGEAGGRMFAQTHSRGVSIVLSFATALPFDRLPEWRSVRSLPLRQQGEQLRDPVLRKKVIAAAYNGDYGQVVGALPRKPDFGSLLVLSKGLPPYKSVQEVANERNTDPVAVIIDLALETDMTQMFIQPVNQTRDDWLLAIMKHRRSVMTFSDAGAHVSQIMDASIQTHLLAYWVREREAFSIEEAIRMLTFSPALAWGIPDRGLIREGMIADINVFNPDEITPCLPVLKRDLPGGASRLAQRCEGIHATVVAGKPLFIDGEHTGSLPGQLIRGPLAHRST
jgi:N-acyl-D-amino-acid deacylase